MKRHRQQIKQQQRRRVWIRQAAKNWSQQMEQMEQMEMRKENALSEIDKAEIWESVLSAASQSSTKDVHYLASQLISAKRLIDKS